MYVIHREEGSYMDRKAMEKWLTYVFRPYAKKLPEGKQGILLLDNFAGHIDDNLKKFVNDLRFDILTFPANTTKFHQPMDISVNKSFKAIVSNFWEDYSSSLTKDDLTKAGNYKPPTREKKLTWVSSAWQEVSSDTVANGFNIYKKSLQKLQDSNQQYLSNTEHQENEDIVEMVFSKEEFDCSDHEYKNEDLLEKGSDDEEYDQTASGGINPICPDLLKYEIVDKN